MKKAFAASILVGSLLFGGISVGAQENISEKKQTIRKSISYEELKIVNEQLKTQTELNKQLLQTYKLTIPKDVKDRVKQVLEEVKPLRIKNKELGAQLKAAKTNKDKDKVQQLKIQLTENQKEIEKKMTLIQPDIYKIKQYQSELKKLKEQMKSITKALKAKQETVHQLKQKLDTIIQHAKQSKKQGNKEQVHAYLVEADGLAEQITILKKEILAQKTVIGDILQQK
ncbi:hypothetical protein ACFSO7_15260 [Bacillus sp. CGMCC 1.16607]|uniref:hypothetical protein n=1 Tax=Bacillus sp. CGMCC 1.16607 TaxID=3351842 RepID=UPI00362579B3